ncbi:MAG: 4'-phosphopantetheinyl transferase superfamily protein [Oleiphilaceae bacterium]|nr:4'-phosphopantetheinyl transferase superfamily protein [Oleiphilaceae bacterium]
MTAFDFPDTCYMQSNIDDTVTSQLADLGYQLPPGTVRFSAKRLKEFMAGRLCAIRAMAGLNVHTQTLEINTDRSPVWPNEIVGSISHTDSRAIALVGDSRVYRSIGVDLQPAVDPDTRQELRSIIMTEVEFELVKAMLHLHAFELVFSAKETLFKALYPLTKCFFEFHDAQVTALNTQRHYVDLRLLKTLGSGFEEGTSYRVHYLIDQDNEVLSYLLIVR